MYILERDYDIDFNPELDCFEFFIIKEKKIGKCIIEAYLLGRLYRGNGNFVLKVSNGPCGRVSEEEVRSFVGNEEKAIQLSKKCLDLFLV